MGTCNFHSMEDFDLIVFDTDYQGTIEDARQAYLEFNDDDMSDNEIMEWADFTASLDAELLYSELKRELIDFNYDLKFYDISVKSGYYAGLQLYAKEKREWYCDYYGCIVDSMMKKERRIINEFFHKLGRDYGGII